MRVLPAPQQAIPEILRHARLVLPHDPHHIIQRGHNRQIIFARDDDYMYYLDILRTWKTHYGVKVYVFCLMTTHIRLLLAHGKKPAAFSPPS